MLSRFLLCEQDHLSKAYGQLDGNKRKVGAVQREKDAHLARLERYREEVQQQETELEVSPLPPLIPLATS